MKRYCEWREQRKQQLNQWDMQYPGQPYPPLFLRFYRVTLSAAVLFLTLAVMLVAIRHNIYDYLVGFCLLGTTVLPCLRHGLAGRQGYYQHHQPQHIKNRRPPAHLKA